MKRVSSITAIIPTYNRKNWLGEALDSVLQQTRPPEEIILVDDGSTDGTAAFVRERYPAVRYLSREKQGPAAARNAGAAAANGEWLAFLDSDDCWLPQKLQRQVEFLQQHPQCEAVYTDEIWIRNGRRVNQGKRHRKYGGWIYAHCVPLCIISPSSILLSRRLFEALGGFDPEYPACEDYELWLRMSARYPVGYLDEPLIVKHGGHADQLSKQWGLDRYRVAALEKMLAQGTLHAEWRDLTIRDLIRRCDILAAGCKKHGRVEEAEFFLQKGRDWRMKISS